MELGGYRECSRFAASMVRDYSNFEDGSLLSMMCLRVKEEEGRNAQRHRMVGRYVEPGSIVEEGWTRHELARASLAPGGASGSYRLP